MVSYDMFTSNSMNCLTGALGLSLPGNDTTLAAHSDRRQLFKEAGRLIIRISKKYYLRATLKLFLVLEKSRVCLLAVQALDDLLHAKPLHQIQEKKYPPQMRLVLG